MASVHSSEFIGRDPIPRLLLRFATPAIISSFIIYIRMQTHEGETAKSFLTLLGAILFMIGASIVFPAFFGYHT